MSAASSAPIVHKFHNEYEDFLHVGTSEIDGKEVWFAWINIPRGQKPTARFFNSKLQSKTKGELKITWLPHLDLDNFTGTASEKGLARRNECRRIIAEHTQELADAKKALSDARKEKYAARKKPATKKSKARKRQRPAEEPEQDAEESIEVPAEPSAKRARRSMGDAAPGLQSGVQVLIPSPPRRSMRNAATSSNEVPQPVTNNRQAAEPAETSPARITTFPPFVSSHAPPAPPTNRKRPAESSEHTLDNNNEQPAQPAAKRPRRDARSASVPVRDTPNKTANVAVNGHRASSHEPSSAAATITITDPTVEVTIPNNSGSLPTTTASEPTVEAAMPNNSGVEPTITANERTVEEFVPNNSGPLPSSTLSSPPSSPSTIAPPTTAGATNEPIGHTVEEFIPTNSGNTPPPAPLPPAPPAPTTTTTAGQAALQPTTTGEAPLQPTTTTGQEAHPPNPLAPTASTTTATVPPGPANAPAPTTPSSPPTFLSANPVPALLIKPEPLSHATTNLTTVLVTASNQPGVAPASVPLHLCPTLESLFTTLIAEYDITSEEPIKKASVTYPWSGRRHLLRRGKEEDWWRFVERVRKAWESEGVRENWFFEEGCEIEILVHAR